jgi:hypothetical protein
MWATPHLPNVGQWCYIAHDFAIEFGTLIIDYIYENLCSLYETCLF